MAHVLTETLTSECIQCGERIFSVNTGPVQWHSYEASSRIFICQEDDFGPMSHDPMETELIPEMTNVAALTDWLET